MIIYKIYISPDILSNAKKKNKNSFKIPTNFISKEYYLAN